MQVKVEVVGDVFLFVDYGVRVDYDGLVVRVLGVAMGVIWAVTAASATTVGWVHDSLVCLCSFVLSRGF